MDASYDPDVEAAVDYKIAAEVVVVVVAAAEMEERMKGAAAVGVVDDRVVVADTDRSISDSVAVVDHSTPAAAVVVVGAVGHNRAVVAD